MSAFAFRRMILIFSSLFFLLPSLASCSKTEKAPALPGLSDFRWGENPEETAGHFTRSGWKKKLRIDNQLQLVVPIDEETRAALLENFGKDIPENYTMTLFSQKGRLLIAKIYRQDPTKEMEDWLSKIKESLKLRHRIWKSKIRRERLAAGAELEEESTVYDTGDLFVVVHTARSKLRGKLPAKGKQIRLEDGANMEVEIRLYHKQENEGLTGEALIRQVSRGAGK